MSDEPTGSSPIVRNILLALGGIYVVASVVFGVMAFTRIDDLERKQATRQDELAKKIEDNNNQNRATMDALIQKLGMTRQDLTKKAMAIQKEQKAIESRVSANEEDTKREFGAVSGAVNGVKTDVGKVKDDVTATRSDLES